MHPRAFFGSSERVALALNGHEELMDGAVPPAVVERQRALAQGADNRPVDEQLRMIDAAERDRGAERGRRPIKETHLRLLRRADGGGRIAFEPRRDSLETHLETAPAVVAGAETQIQRALGEVL